MPVWSWLKIFRRRDTSALISASSTDPRLMPILVSRPPAEAVRWAADVLSSLRGWTVDDVDPDEGMLSGTLPGRFSRRESYVMLLFVPEGSGTRIVGSSHSTVVGPDTGHDAWNLVRVAEALRESF